MTNNKVNGTIERGMHRVFICIHINNKQVMKADVSNIKQKTREYLLGKIVRAVHTTLEIK